MSSASFPTRELHKIINRTDAYFQSYPTFEAFKNDFLTVNIYYPYTKYTRITELPKVTVYDLFANLGGSMGIFLGYTLFSFIEILVIFIQILVDYCEDKRAARKLNKPRHVAVQNIQNTVNLR